MPRRPPLRRKRPRAPRSPASVPPTAHLTSNGRRLALLIGNGKVQSGDRNLVDIPGIDNDLATLGGVLADAESGGFEVRRLYEPTLIEARRAVARATRDVEEADTLLVYYSGTSTVADGQLYLPVIDSDVEFLEATCLESDYVLSCLRRSKSRRQVLLMDGCHSGAFFSYNRGIPDGFCAIMSCGPDEVCYGTLHGWYKDKLGSVQQIACPDDAAANGAWFEQLLTGLRHCQQTQPQGTAT